MKTVRRVEEAATTRGGLIIPDSAKDKPQEGKIISAGKGKTKRGGQIVPTRGEGRRRRTPISASTPAPKIKLDGEDVFIMKEEKVPGTVTGAGKKETVGARETAGARK